MLMGASSSARSSVCWMLWFSLEGGLLFDVLPLSLLISLVVSASQAAQLCFWLLWSLGFDMDFGWLALLVGLA